MTESQKYLLLALTAVLAGAVYWDRSEPHATAGTQPGGQSAVGSARPPTGGPAGGPTRSPGAKPARTDAELAVHPLAALARAELVATVERPLFEQKRRRYVEPPPPPSVIPPLPPATAPSSSAAPPPDPNAFRVVGIIVGGKRSTALVIKAGTEQTLRVEEGQTVDSWVVDKIQRDHIVMSRNKDRMEFRMLRRPSGA